MSMFSDSYAMSPTVDLEASDTAYKPSEWSENSDAEADARSALENNDHRLLAFALRATNVPGIKPEQVKRYEKQCGLRFMKKFGDVIRSTEDIERMKKAHDYASQYNAIITSKCSLNE